MNIVYLTITTYRGYGGWHYYGWLRDEARNRHDLTYELNRSDVARLNKLEPGSLVKYKVGNRSTRFEKRERLIEQARAVWRSLYPGALFLIEGADVYAEPQRILDGPACFVDRLNALYAQADELGWWDGGHRAQVQEIADRWDALLLEATETEAT